MIFVRPTAPSTSGGMTMKLVPPMGMSSSPWNDVDGDGDATLICGGGGGSVIGGAVTSGSATASSASA